jgi:predicted XRE-type DNA-binding protein
MKRKKTIVKDVVEKKVEVGYESVYAQLGYKSHVEMETKSNLVGEISKSISQRKLIEKKAAEIFNIPESKLYEILNGRFRVYSIDSLTHFLNKIGSNEGEYGSEF